MKTEGATNSDRGKQRRETREIGASGLNKLRERHLIKKETQSK